MKQSRGRASRRPAPAPAGRAALPALPWLEVLALALLAAAWLQRGAVRAAFFADDFLFLDQVRARPLWSVLAGPDPIGNFVRPVSRQLYFWVLARLGGESPLLFHAAGLALFLAILGLLFLVARRLAGTVAAAIATAFVALHYAADVPLLWASGSQELLALAGALGALALFLAGRRGLAALALFAALLSKETVLVTPLVAVLAARRRGEPWRASLARAWPLGVALAAWAALWLAVAARSPGARQAVSWGWPGVAAAFVHLPQVALGLEWRPGGALRLLTTVPPLVPLAFALAALLLAGREREGSAPGTTSPVQVGVAWALLGTLPVTVVASSWSAYYYLFALCGIGLALGAWLAPRPRWAACLVIAVLAWGSEGGRRLDEFNTRPDVWATQSHVNRLYVERATTECGRLLTELKALRPTLPHGATLFFGGLLSWIGFQVGDGPLVRWAYRDTSLRSYHLLGFTAERFRRGTPLLFLDDVDGLRERPWDREALTSVAMRAALSEQPRLALDVLDVALERFPADRLARYWSVWPCWALGDTAEALRRMRAVGIVPDRGPGPEAAEAMSAIAAGDTVTASRRLAAGIERHALDPGPHAVLARLYAYRPDGAVPASFEGLAAVTLEPRDPQIWGLWGALQAKGGHMSQAAASLERYFALGGGPPEEMEWARNLLESIRKRLPGGALVREELRKSAQGQP